MAEEQESTLAAILADENADAAGELPSWGADDADTDIDVIIDDSDAGAPPEEPEDAPAAAEAPAVVAPAVEEPPEPADATVTDADLEAGDHAYPEPIKKRIKREIRIRKKVQEEFEQVRGAALQAVQYAQAKDTELMTARNEITSLRKQHASVLELAFDKDIALKRIELREAREAGKFDDETRIQGEMSTLQFQQNQIREVKRTLDAQPAPAAAPPAAAAPAPGQPTQSQREPPAPLAVAWINRNKTWFQNPKFAGHKAFVLGEDAQLVREGYDKNSPEYYAELDRRVDTAFPTLRKPAAPNAGGSAGAPPVAAVTGGGGKPAPKGSVRLTKIDLANMRRFGLDPSNKTHLKQYALEKRSSV